jgi:hypothetical protein
MMLSALLIAAGMRRLDTFSGATAHYGAAVGLALLLRLLPRHRPAASILTTVLLASLLTFALRRWLGFWVNLEAFDWGSGPASGATAVVFPLEGLLFGFSVGDGVHVRPTDRSRTETA